MLSFLGSIVGRELQFEDQIIDEMEEEITEEIAEEVDDPEEATHSNNNNDESEAEEAPNTSNSNLETGIERTPNGKRPRIENENQNNSSAKKSDKKWTLIKDLSADNHYKKYDLKGKILNAYQIENWRSDKTGTPKTGFKKEFTFSDGFDTIRCTAWNDVCDQIQYSVQPGHYVYISGATVAVSTFGKTLGQKELKLNNGAVVTPYEPKFKFKGFVDFKDLRDKIGQKVDVIGVITYFINTKDPKRKDMNLKDKNNYKISVSLQNKTAQHFGGKKTDIIAIKNAIVVNANCIKSGKTTNCIINPRVPEASLLISNNSSPQ